MIHRNPDERTRNLEREWLATGEPRLLAQLTGALRRSGELEGTEANLARLRSRWALLAERKRRLRRLIKAYRRWVVYDSRHWALTGDQSRERAAIAEISVPLAEELAHELGRHGKLWATLAFGAHQSTSVRVHDEKDAPKGAAYTDWNLMVIDRAPGRGGYVNLDLKTFGTSGSPLRTVLESLRRTYGARSLALELRESEENDPARPWRSSSEWASHARAIGKAARGKGVVGWNPPRP